MTMTNNELARELVATGARRFEEITGFRPTEHESLIDAVEILVALGGLAAATGDRESAEHTADQVFDLVLQVFAHEMMSVTIGNAIRAEAERAAIIAQYGPEVQA